MMATNGCRELIMPINWGLICKKSQQLCTWRQVLDFWHGVRYVYKVFKKHCKQVGFAPSAMFAMNVILNRLVYG